MALSVKEQTQYWGVAFALLFVVLWGLGDVILPFVIGGALAYCLDPVADKLEERGLSRVSAVSLISLAAFLITLAAFILVVPLLIGQINSLLAQAPEFPDKIHSFIETNFPSMLDQDSAVYKQVAGLIETLKANSLKVFQSIWTSALGVVNVAVLIVVVPVVTFYLLLDWDHMIARIDRLLPRDHAATIRLIAKDIDKTLASFIRGQGTVCLSMGAYYAIGLMAVGLNFGLIVGVIAGLITFIPYVGAIVGGALAIGLAIVQFWGDFPWIIAVSVIFAIGQFLEGNILTPRLVGHSVGLHPVWLIFALSVFGSLFGFVGMLVAVPVAAIIGVLTRFILSQYEGSRLYKGLTIHEADTKDAE